MKKINFKGLVLIAQITQGKMIGKIIDNKNFTKFFCMYEKINFEECFEKLKQALKEGKYVYAR